MSTFVVKINKNDIAKTANMAKTLLKVANSLTKNVSSNKIITDTKKSEKNERKDRGRSLDAKRMARGAGILLAITSLPSSYGIGTLGDAAFQFIDLLVDLKQRYWQVLPIGPTSFGDSPYQSYSAFAGNPYLIDLDDLVQEKLLSVEEIRSFHWGNDEADIEALKEYETTLHADILFYEFCQFEFFKQWKKLKEYANNRGIQLIGDLPFYVALDSVDVWANRELFLLEEDGTPKGVAGSPPDAFSENGQKWGSPVYNWSRMEEDGFAWWQARMLEHAKLFDVIRLDHFAAIVKYYVVPNKAEDGRSGKWSRGPGKKLTDAIEKVIGDTHIIVEDIAGKSPIPGVKKLMARTGWPGIKILMFAFGDDTANEHLPHNYTDCNLVVYAGTHDNETIVGYFRDKTDYELAYLYEYLNIKYKEEIPDALIRAAYASIADVVIIQMQDLMKLGNEARMNAPSTVGRNWRWRIGTDELSEERRAWIRTLASVYHR